MAGPSSTAISSFPREFKGSLFGHPDWRFGLICLLCAALIGGITFKLAMIERPATASEEEVVEIQKRYAKIVLNIDEKKLKPKPKPKPKPKKKKKKPAIKIEKKKVEPKKVVKEAKKEIIKPPEIKVRTSKRYSKVKESKKIDLKMEENAKLSPDIALPDVGKRVSKRYAKKSKKVSIEETIDEETTSTIAGPVPDIQIKSAKKYGGRSRSAPTAPALDMDISGDEPATGFTAPSPEIQVASKRRYKSTGSRGSGTTGSITMDDSFDSSDEELGTGIGIAAPDTRSGRSGRYSRGGSGSQTDLVDEGDEKAVNLGVDKGGTLPATKAIRHLAACVDPNEEPRLKRQIITYTSKNGQRCEDAFGAYQYFNIDMASTLDVRFVSYKAGRYNRCDALRMALQCIIK